MAEKILDDFLDDTKLRHICDANLSDPKVRAALSRDKVTKILYNSSNPRLRAFAASSKGDHSKTNVLLKEKDNVSVSTCNFTKFTCANTDAVAVVSSSASRDLSPTVTKFARSMLDDMGMAVAIKELQYVEYKRRMHRRQTPSRESTGGSAELGDDIRARNIKQSTGRNYLPVEFSQQYINNATDLEFFNLPPVPSFPPSQVKWTEERDDNNRQYLAWDSTNDSSTYTYYGMGTKGKIYARLMPTEERLNIDSYGAYDFYFILEIQYEVTNEVLREGNSCLMDAFKKEEEYPPLYFLMSTFNKASPKMEFVNGKIYAGVVQGISGIDMTQTGAYVPAFGSELRALSVPGTHNVPVDVRSFHDENVVEIVNKAYFGLNNMQNTLTNKLTSEKDKEKCAADITKIAEISHWLDLSGKDCGEQGSLDFESVRRDVQREGDKKIDEYINAMEKAVDFEIAAAIASAAAIATSWFPWVSIAATVASMYLTWRASGVREVGQRAGKDAMEYINTIGSKVSSHTCLSAIGKYNEECATVMGLIADHVGPNADHASSTIIQTFFSSLHDIQEKNQGDEKYLVVEQFKNMGERIGANDDYTELRYDVVLDGLKNLQMAEWIGKQKLEANAHKRAIMPNTMNQDVKYVTNCTSVTACITAVVEKYDTGSIPMYSPSNVISILLQAGSSLTAAIAGRVQGFTTWTQISMSSVQLATSAVTVVGFILNIYGAISSIKERYKLKEQRAEMKKAIADYLELAGGSYTDMWQIFKAIAKGNLPVLTTTHRCLQYTRENETDDLSLVQWCGWNQRNPHMYFRVTFNMKFLGVIPIIPEDGEGFSVNIHGVVVDNTIIEKCQPNLWAKIKVEGYSYGAINNNVKVIIDRTSICKVRFNDIKLEVFEDATMEKEVFSDMAFTTEGYSTNFKTAIGRNYVLDWPGRVTQVE